MEMVLEAGDIAQAMQEVRAQTGQGD